MLTNATLKAISDKTAARLAQDPSLAQGGGRTEVRIRQGLTCEISDGNWRMRSDLPLAAGGANLGPDPGVLTRAALGSCLAMDIVTWASRLGVPVNEVSVAVESRIDARGNLGTAEVPAGYSHVNLDIRVESAVRRERIEALIDTAAWHNPRLHDLTQPVPVTRRLTVLPAETDVVPVAANANQPVTIRPARRDDCAAIARYFLIASDGLAEYIWSLFPMPGLSLLEIGAARYARQGVAFSYENCLLVEKDGVVVGMMHAFPMEASPADEVETNPVLRPYSELEDPGSLYIAGLAIDAAHRVRGLGTRLLQAAEVRAQALGLPRVSLICFERNAGAMRLYQRMGYRETQRRALVPHPSLHYRDGDAILLVKTLG